MGLEGLSIETQESALPRWPIPAWIKVKNGKHPAKNRALASLAAYSRPS